ncbi:MAG: hypothetical protein K8R48_07890 [Alphaproteobacteria bacterium]|nr:hypothetical protein [Alphaproteobacteria bacterium]
MTKNNKEIKLYAITLKQASLTDVGLEAFASMQDVYKVDALQKKITSNAKSGIRKALKKNGLTMEFATVSKKIPAKATQFLALTNKETIKVLKKNVGGIKSVRKA